MSDYDDLIKRFSSARGQKYVMKHYAEFPLDAKLVHEDGTCAAVVELAIKKISSHRHPHYMQTIWKLEEGREASEKFKVPYLIVCKFSDCDLFYQFDASHKLERRKAPEGASVHEQRAISGSVFIPMLHFQPFTIAPKTKTPDSAPILKKVTGPVYEEEPL